MTLHDALPAANRPDVAVCRSAARLLRTGQDPVLTVEGLALPLARLLSAVSLGLQSTAIPPDLRSAAVELAEHLVRRSSIPVQRGAPEPAHRPTIPFSASLRLGRMG